MKTIESIGEIDPAWPGPIMTFRRGGGAFTEIEIDDGLVGIGPAVDPDTVTAAKNILVGQNPFHVFWRRAAIFLFKYNSFFNVLKIF